MPTITDLSIGAKLKFGAYSVSGEMPHKICWIKVHRDGTILSEFIEDQCAFDAREPDNPIEYRGDRGSNRYSKSNCHQFLNADGMEWFRPAHEYDRAPEDFLMHSGRYGYARKPGFLHYFKEWEIEAIEDSEIKTAVPVCDISDVVEVYETIHAKVFLPSRNNINSEAENGLVEGEAWDLFAAGARLVCPLSTELYINTRNSEHPKYGDEGWIYFLRSSNVATSDGVYCVNDGGAILRTFPYNDYLGIRPALKLNPETIISDKPDGNGYYEVLSAPQGAIDIDERDYFAILKKT